MTSVDPVELMVCLKQSLKPWFPELVRNSSPAAGRLESWAELLSQYGDSQAKGILLLGEGSALLFSSGP